MSPIVFILIGSRQDWNKGKDLADSEAVLGWVHPK